jgi:hypothetical protein
VEWFEVKSPELKPQYHKKKKNSLSLKIKFKSELISKQRLVMVLV